MLKINKIPFTLGLNLCVFASGSGSNLRAIIKASLSGYIKSKVVLVISNNSSSGAKETAAKFKIPFIHLSQKLFKTEQELTENILKALVKYRTDLIVLAGYMKKLPEAVIEAYPHRIVKAKSLLENGYNLKQSRGTKEWANYVLGIRRIGSVVPYSHDGVTDIFLRRGAGSVEFLSREPCEFPDYIGYTFFADAPR